MPVETNSRNIDPKNVVESFETKTFLQPSDLLSVEKLILLSEKVNNAYQFAEKVHEGQKRYSGEPYTSHLKAVTNIVLEEWLEVSKEVYHQDPQKIENLTIACLLHDSIEDQGVDIELIRNNFGDEVAELVNGVTNLKISDFEDLKQEMKKSFRESANFRH